MDFNNNTYDFSNMFNVEERQLNLEPTKQLGSITAGLGAKDVIKPKASSSLSGVEKLASIWSSIAEAFSDNPDDLVDPYEKGRDQAGEVYSKYDILEPIEDPAKARRIGGLTTKNLPMPVDAPVGRQRFSIFPEAEEEVVEEVVEDKVDDGLMSRQVTPEERAALSKLKADDIGDGLMSRQVTAEERTALSDRGPSWQKAQGLPIYKNGIFDKATMESSLEDSGLVGSEASLLKGAIKTEVGTAGPITEIPYSIGNLGSGTGNFKTGNRWDRELKRQGLLNANGSVTQMATDLNRQGRLSDTILDVVYAGGRLGNGDFASGDGSRYKGRGLIQITGRNNYQAVQDRLAATGLNIDLMANPELVNDERYALPATLAMMDILGVNSSSADTMSAKTLNNAINSGADRTTAQERWENVLNAASPAERAELELRDEYAAQIEVGITGTYSNGRSKIDGDIGTGTKARMDAWAAPKGLTLPVVTPITKVSNRTGNSYVTYSPEDKLKLTIFVNENK